VFNIENLFDARSNVGAKLEAILEEREYTKARLCKETGVSRPTLDKVLAGMITSKANYERHIQRIMDCLHLTPDMLMANGRPIKKNQLRAMRNAMRAKAEDIASFSGMSVERLMEIESGEEATLAELRDIALCLNTGTRNVLGEAFFEDQMATLNYFLPDDTESVGHGCGFWGHIGILLVGSDEYFWYPISSNTYHQVYRQLQGKGRIAIPCMNNKLLYLELSNIKQVLLLDEACDQPGFANWDSRVSCGEIPNVIFEALDDYLRYEDMDDERDSDEMSDRFYEVMKRVAEENGWDESTIYKMDGITLHYRDGKVTHTDVDWYSDSSLVDDIETHCLFDDIDDDEDGMLAYEDSGNTIIFVNMKEIAMIELPLIRVENSICDSMLEDYED